MTASPRPTVLVTRPAAQAAAWVEALREAGVAAQALPLLQIDPAPDRAAVAAMYAQLRAASDSVSDPAGALQSFAPLAVFVSPNAAREFFAVVGTEKAWPAGVGTVWPTGAWAAATGPGTVAALVSAGVPPERIVAPLETAGQFDSEALWRVIGPWPWQGRPVWIVRGNGGRDWLSRQLAERGAALQRIQAYVRSAPRWSAAEQALHARTVAEPRRWVWLFSSSEAVDHLCGMADPDDASRTRAADAFASAFALASHPRIAAHARARGFERVREIGAGPAAVVQATREMDFETD